MGRTARYLIWVALLALYAPGLRAQNASIFGAVHDEQTGEEIVGANVVVVETKLGATTDIDGKYLIKNVPAGSYDLRISYIGYGVKTISGVVVKADETLTLNINISSSIVQADEVTVTAERMLSSEAAILAERKKAATIGDGISQEQVKRTPDATSGDALKRVTGVSIVDNKFVFIRGITDRYNGTTLDGASVSNTEAGKKSFAFDLIPASLLENTNIVKSSTPDLPGDFTGGLVQLSTLDIPNRFSGKLSVSGSYNNLTSSKSIMRAQGGSEDWLGIDDGARALPDGSMDGAKLAQAMKNTWDPQIKRAPYNSSYSASFGDQLSFDEGDASGGRLGFIGALTYRNSFQRNERTLDDRDQSRFTVGPRDDYSVLWGGIANLTYKFGGTQKISIKNNYDRTADDRVAQYSMLDGAVPLLFNITQIQYTQRSSYTGQILGEHVFPSLGDLLISWKASLSSSSHQEPDWKEAVYYVSPDDPAQVPTTGNSRRQWSHGSDRVTTFGVDLALPVSDAKIKWGALAENATTNYDIRGWKISPDRYPHNTPDSLTHLTLDDVFSPENYGQGKFLFQEYTHPTDNYEGGHTLYAGYAMADVPFEIAGNRFRFAGGARLENYEQNVVVHNTLDGSGPANTNMIKNIDILPSMNLTYIFSDIANLRFAYSHSVNRPEVRERSQTRYEDFILNELVTGDTSLQRSYIHNYDARVEVFPSPGELIALSYFEKYISNAIEQELLFSGTRTRKPFNSPRAKNYGWELEIRKSFSFVSDYLANLSVNANYTRIISRVEYMNTLGNSANTYFELATRQMQGQSPYMINVSLLFTEPTLHTSLNISYNKAGKRIETVGFLGSDIYEEPRDIVDIAVNQPIALGLEAKFTIKNLNGKDRVHTRDGLLYEKMSTGTTYGFQVSLSL